MLCKERRYVQSDSLIPHQTGEFVGQPVFIQSTSASQRNDFEAVFSGYDPISLSVRPGIPFFHIGLCLLDTFIQRSAVCFPVNQLLQALLQFRMLRTGEFGAGHSMIAAGAEGMKALSHRQSVNRMREKAVHLHRHIKDRSLHSLVVVIRAEAFAVGHSQGQKPGLDIYLADVVRERFPPESGDHFRERQPRENRCALFVPQTEHMPVVVGMEQRDLSVGLKFMVA